MTEAEGLYEKGVEAADRGSWLTALAWFEKAVQLDDKPVYHSCLAACIAKERGQYNKAVRLCREAIEKEPENPVHYLNLGRISLFQGRKEEAMALFREGLKHGYEKRIIDELERLGTRKKPVISFLHRNNPVNKYLGIILKKMRIR
jgi:tetratricopeptide (TPR) repeat protein